MYNGCIKKLYHYILIRLDLFWCFRGGSSNAWQTQYMQCLIMNNGPTTFTMSTSYERKCENLVQFYWILHIFKKKKKDTHMYDKFRFVQNQNWSKSVKFEAKSIVILL